MLPRSHVVTTTNAIVLHPLNVQSSIVGHIWSVLFTKSPLMNMLWENVNLLNWRVEFVDNEKDDYLFFGTSIWFKS